MANEAENLFGFSSASSYARGDNTFENLEKRRIDFKKNIYVPYSHKIMHYQRTD